MAVNTWRLSLCQIPRSHSVSAEGLSPWNEREEGEKEPAAHPEGTRLALDIHHKQWCGTMRTENSTVWNGVVADTLIEMG